MPTVSDLFYHPLTGEHLPASRTNEILGVAMRVMGLDSWPEGEDEISHPQLAQARRELGLFGDAATTTDADSTPDDKPRIPAKLPATVGGLIDLVAEDPEHKVINQLATVLTACMRVMDSDGWPEGREPLTPEQATAVLVKLGYHDPNAPTAPNIAERKPVVLELEPGTYYWCRCGLSQNQPWCDGSHNAAGVFSPLEYKVEDATRVALCRCKHTNGPPICDGTHKTLPKVEA